MKKLSEILRLPIMEILGGQVLGSIRDIVMNPDTKEILMVLDKGVFSDFYILAKADVVGIGNDFIMIRTAQAIQSSRENLEVMNLLAEYYPVQGLTVITTEGNIAGKIADFTMDEKSWQIDEIYLEDGKAYAKNQIISISEKYVFVQTEASEDLSEETEPETKEDDGEASLIGMTMRAKVEAETGDFVLEAGTVITEEILEEAKVHGILASVIMNAE